MEQTPEIVARTPYRCAVGLMIKTDEVSEQVCVLLSGCGHWVQRERLAEVNAEMIDFLRCERRR
jgi:hypothetical protein